MNTNVSYYVSAFDKNGKRLASHILNKSNDNKEIAEKKELLSGVEGAEVIEVVSAEDFEEYLNGKIRDTKTGKPVDSPEQVISDEEKRASQANAIAQKYSNQIAELKDAMITAQLAGDADLAKSLTEEYKETMDAYTQELEALK